MHRVLRRTLKGLLVSILLIGSTLLLTELMLRAFLFFEPLHVKSLRRADLYAVPGTDSCWLLEMYLDRRHLPTSSELIHPLFGWSQTKVSPENPLGLASLSVLQLSRQKDKKKEILFYGDSFVNGVSRPENYLPSYMGQRIKNSRVINLSVGGFGLDQSYLMYTQTRERLKKPLILLGILLDDLDRSVLSIRTYQKPYFTVTGGKLELKGLPIDPDPSHFMATHSPGIPSYFLSFLRRQLALRYTAFQRNESREAEIKAISRAILTQFKNETDERGTPLKVVIFYDVESLGAVSWREQFLKEELDDLGIPYIDTKPALIDYANKHKIPAADFYEGGNGHHIDLGNQVIGEALIEDLSKDGFERSQVLILPEA